MKGGEEKEGLFIFAGCFAFEVLQLPAWPPRKQAEPVESPWLSK